MERKLTVEGFEPLFLTLDRVGPFQENLEEIDFTSEQNSPCNLFMLMSANGKGKTTLLEIMTHLMGLLDKDQLYIEKGVFYSDELGHEDLEEGRGRAQWDLLLTLVTPEEKSRIIFTIAAGGIAPWSLKSWDQEDLQRYDASEHCVLGFEKQGRRFSRTLIDENNWVLDLQDLISENIGKQPLEVQDEGLRVPKLIYFTAYRDILHIDSKAERPISVPTGRGYTPVRTFDRGSVSWNDSPDQLLVWLKWLDANNGTQLLEKTMRILNEKFFEIVYQKRKKLTGTKAYPPEAIIRVDGQNHRLDRLSSGEKSILQLMLRIPAEMTGKTLVLIDEIGVHLHPNWQRLAYLLIREMAISFPSLTFIFSSHSLEVFDAFDYEREEEGLVKGGFIIEDNLT